MDSKGRSFTRFKPDPLDVALIDFKPKAVKFEPQKVALLLNESFSGCALLMNTHDPIEKGKKVRIQVGRLSPMLGEIVWVKHLEEDLFKVGVKLLE